MWTQGRHLWARTLGSTLVGQGLDLPAFIAIAFGDLFAPAEILTAIASRWLFKTVYEVVATPLIYVVANRPKQAEGVDAYDVDTDLNPCAF